MLRFVEALWSMSVGPFWPLLVNVGGVCCACWAGSVGGRQDVNVGGLVLTLVAELVIVAAMSESPDALARRLNRGARSGRRLRAEAPLPFGPCLELHGYTLGNGMRVRLLPDPASPVVSYHTWYEVGSRDEEQGKTGLAHLLEHLMFGATQRLAAGEFDRRVESVGGESNASTWTDWTQYHINLPAAQVDVAINLEADRMVNLRLQPDTVASEKEVVANERRYRVDDDVSGTVSERLYATAYRKHGYRWPTIGWMQDIQAFSLEDVRAFYERYYAPDNATVVVAGGFDEQTVLAHLQAAYGGLRPSRSKRPVHRRERPIVRAQRLQLRWPTPTDKVAWAFPSPAFGAPGWTALQLLLDVLFGGRSSRLVGELVVEREWASDVHAFAAPFAEPGLLEIWLAMRPDAPTGDAMRRLGAALQRVQREAVSDEELARAKSRLELSTYQELESMSGMAEQVGFYETVLSSPARLFEDVELALRLRPQDLLRVARKTFVKERRLQVRVHPSDQSGEHAHAWLCANASAGPSARNDARFGDAASYPSPRGRPALAGGQGG